MGKGLAMVWSRRVRYSASFSWRNNSSSDSRRCAMGGSALLSAAGVGKVSELGSRVSENPSTLAKPTETREVCKMARDMRAKMPLSCIFSAIRVGSR